MFCIISGNTEASDNADEETIANAAYCLLLPGKTLDLSALLVAKKFRYRGNKEGAISVLKLLEKDGLGKVASNYIASDYSKDVGANLYCGAL